MKLRTWRKRRDMTQGQLAGFLGVTRRTIIRYEMGHIIPAAAQLREIEHRTEGMVKPADWFRLVKARESAA